MRGIVLAGGTGSRLGALSKTINKHLLPVGFVPMIYHPISQLLVNGIKEICIVSGTFHLGTIVSLLGSGSQFGCSFTYKVQDNAGGIAEALNLCKDFSQGDDIAVLLGDNVFGNVLDFSFKSSGKFFLKAVEDPERFGIAEVDHLKKLIDIEEKPANPKSNLAVLGAYIYNNYIWDAINTIQRSPRGELEISDANKIMIKWGVETEEITGRWWDTGTIKSYRKANEEVWDSLDKLLTDQLEKMVNI